MNKGYALVGIGMVMLIAFSGCLGNGGNPANNTTDYTGTPQTDNNPEVSNDTATDAAGQISSQLMNESDDIDIGEMI